MKEVTSAPTSRDHVDLMRVWFRFVRLNRRLSSAMSEVLKPIGLSIPQFDILSTLTECEGLTQNDLASRLYVTKGNVSGLIDRLVKAGLVERRALPTDRRSYALHLTSQGGELARRGLDAQNAFVSATLSKVSDPDLNVFEAAIIDWRDAIRSAKD